MNERDKILLRYVCDGDMRRARQQADGWDCWGNEVEEK